MIKAFGETQDELLKGQCQNKRIQTAYFQASSGHVPALILHMYRQPLTALVHYWFLFIACLLFIFSSSLELLRLPCVPVSNQMKDFEIGEPRSCRGNFAMRLVCKAKRSPWLRLSCFPHFERLDQIKHHDAIVSHQCKYGLRQNVRHSFPTGRCKTPGAKKKHVVLACNTTIQSQHWRNVIYTPSS